MRFETLPGGGLRVLAPAKVNLYLEVLGARPDGYHEIDTLMQAITLHDELEIRPVADAPDRLPGDLRLEVIAEEVGASGLTAGDDNLVLRAGRLVRERLPAEARPAPLDLRLTKRVPLGAGLGGGSSDAAAALVAIDRMWNAQLSRGTLAELAGRLGSDVPFFLGGGLARCRGRGEEIDPLDAAPSERRLHFVLAYPRFQIPTSLIYRELDRQEARPVALTSPPPLDTMTAGSIHEALWRGEIFFNRLESVACRAFPNLGEFKKEIQDQRFIATLMSGSGSTVYGVTRSRREAEEIAARLRPRLSGSLFVADCEPADPSAR